MVDQKCDTLTVWRDFCVFFGVEDKRTAERRLIKLGFRIPKRGAPMIRRSTLEARVDSQS